MLLHPRYLPDAVAFEIAVLLILETEYPRSRVVRRAPPDWGIDLLRDEGGAAFAYQCKHFPYPSKATLSRALRKSLHVAIEHRNADDWRCFTLCVSGDLTAEQIHGCLAVASDCGLRAAEFAVRAGAQFTGTLAKNPWIWAAVTSRDEMARFRRTASEFPPVWADTRLRQVMRRLSDSGAHFSTADVLQDCGIGELSVDDYYGLSSWHADSTRSSMRMTSFDSEIPTFWMLPDGRRYLESNKRLIAQGVRVSRLFAVDLRQTVLERETLAAFLAYVAAQERAGVVCKVMDRTAFSESVRLSCSLFGIQDHDNAVLISRDGSRVVMSRDAELVDESIDVFENLMASREAYNAGTLLDLMNK